ncbi:glycosyltransferase family 87 protein [Streptomyces brasiliensis]|uniref:glycosyltransferase family 87 protein n=1 Tax=Streptomyces brasiliensis TaxID=1954 RepID=UPI00166FF9C7|nr:glycosyltransferase family 87 protein [Streptomyces brasiliensis]
MDIAGARGTLTGLLGVWGLTRLVLLLLVFRVFVFPGADVTSDVSVIYRGWYEVLRHGTFPLDDVTWQYPPAAALAILSPAVLPFLGYTSAFFVLACLADLVVLALLCRTGPRPGRSLRGAWVWVAGLPLLGTTAYARYDVMVTAVAVAALLAGARHPRLMGALAGFAAMVKVWPVLLLLGAVRRRAWGAAAVTAAGVAALFALAMPGAFAFVTFQRDRGTEVESLGALVFHVARHFGWRGEVLLNYGSVEFLGPYVDVVSAAALALTGVAFGWLLLWRLRAVHRAPHTIADAVFTAVLMFTVTSRVISPQYLVWLLGLAAVCLCFRAGRMGVPALLLLAACFVTVLEFPLGFSHVVVSDGYGIGLLLLRNGLLVAATVTAARALWRSTVSAPASTPLPAQAARTRQTPVSS